MKVPEKISGHTPEEKRHRKTGTLSVVASILVGYTMFVPVWEGLLKSPLIDAVAQEAAKELDSKVKESVKEEVQPLKSKVDATNSGLRAVIQSTIFNLEEEIDKLEYIQKYRSAEFTPELRDALFKKKNQLRTQEQALSQIKSSENQNG